MSTILTPKYCSQERIVTSEGPQDSGLQVAWGIVGSMSRFEMWGQKDMLSAVPDKIDVQPVAPSSALTSVPASDPS